MVFFLVPQRSKFYELYRTGVFSQLWINNDLNYTNPQLVCGAGGEFFAGDGAVAVAV